MTGTTESSINDLISLLNVSDTILRYNSDIEKSIRAHGGTVLYSYNNIIIASEIIDVLYSELQKDPTIEFIQDLPLKKYGDLDISLIDQLDLSKIYIGDTGLTVTNGTGGISIDNIGTSGTDGVSGKSKKVTTSGIGNAPIITNDNLTLTATTSDSFSYTILVDGTATLQFIRPANYNGTLQLQNGNTINGQSTSDGMYNIVLKAMNNNGIDTRILILTIFEPVKITNTNFTVSNKIGSQFSYTILSEGSFPKYYYVTDIPSGITLNNNVLSGIFLSAGTYNMNMTVTGLTNSDTKNLIVNVGNPPIITSSDNISSEQHVDFMYEITSTPDSGVTYNIIGSLPEGLSFSSGSTYPVINEIIGKPKKTGVKNVTIKAINLFGETTKKLKITIYQMGG